MAESNSTAVRSSAKKKKSNKAKTERGLKFDVGAMSSATLSGLAALFAALDKSDSRAPVITGNVQIGKKKSIKKRA